MFCRESEAPRLAIKILVPQKPVGLPANRPGARLTGMSGAADGDSDRISPSREAVGSGTRRQKAGGPSNSNRRRLVTELGSSSPTGKQNLRHAGSVVQDPLLHQTQHVGPSRSVHVQQLALRIPLH